MRLSIEQRQEKCNRCARAAAKWQNSRREQSPSLTERQSFARAFIIRAAALLVGARVRAVKRDYCRVEMIFNEHFNRAARLNSRALFGFLVTRLLQYTRGWLRACLALCWWIINIARGFVSRGGLCGPRGHCNGVFQRCFQWTMETFVLGLCYAHYKKDFLN